MDTKNTGTELQRINSFKIIGTLDSADVTNGVRKDNGGQYVSVKAVVKSTIDGVENEFPIEFFASALTKAGTQSKLYDTYSKMADLIGKKVQIDGEIRENRYWSTNLGQMVSAQQLSGRWINGTPTNTPDSAVYEMSGFIISGITERKNKSGELYRYDISIGQSNYSGTGMSRFILHVDPSKRELVNGVEAYEVSDTVKVNGILRFTSTTRTVKEEGNSFGSGLTRTFVDRQKNFFIEGGSAALTEDNGAYPAEKITELINAYKNHDQEIMKSSSSAKEAPSSETKPAVKSRQNSLI
jgi:hypothetical protein